MNISQHEEEKNRKADEKTNALCEEIARMQMSSHSLINTGYFLANLQLSISLIELVLEFIEG